MGELMHERASLAHEGVDGIEDDKQAPAFLQRHSGPTGRIDDRQLLAVAVREVQPFERKHLYPQVACIRPRIERVVFRESDVTTCVARPFL